MNMPPPMRYPPDRLVCSFFLLLLSQVREVELSMDMPSILRLLDFLEALFNGGSDFNEPLKRCLNRLTDAKWANSDILLVSGACVRACGSKRQTVGSQGLPACLRFSLPQVAALTPLPAALTAALMCVLLLLPTCLLLSLAADGRRRAAPAWSRHHEEAVWCQGEAGAAGAWPDCGQP